MEVNVAEDILKAGMQRTENVEATCDDNKPSSAINEDEEHQRISNVFQDSRISSISSFSSGLEILHWLMFFFEVIGILAISDALKFPAVLIVLLPLFVAHLTLQFFISFSMGVYFNQIEIRELLKEMKNRPDERG